MSSCFTFKFSVSLSLSYTEPVSHDGENTPTQDLDVTRHPLLQQDDLPYLLKLRFFWVLPIPPIMFTYTVIIRLPPNKSRAKTAGPPVACVCVKITQEVKGKKGPSHPNRCPS